MAGAELAGDKSLRHESLRKFDSKRVGLLIMRCSLAIKFPAEFLFSGSVDAWGRMLNRTVPLRR